MNLNNVSFKKILMILHMCVALCRTPSILGVLWPCFFGFTAIFGAIDGVCTLDTLHLKHVNLFSDVTLLNDAVMSSVMSQHAACIDHMTF